MKTRRCITHTRMCLPHVCEGIVLEMLRPYRLGEGPPCIIEAPRDGWQNGTYAGIGPFWWLVKAVVVGT